MKPIEPGCLALCAGGKFENHYIPACTVVVLSGPHPKSRGVCPICLDYRNFYRVSGLPFSAKSCCKCALTRIDGGDPDAITETGKEVTA